jgi:hypothetical protein
MGRFEVHDGSRSPQVEQVLPYAAISCAAALLSSDMGQPMLNRDAFAELMAAAARRDPLA